MENYISKPAIIGDNNDESFLIGTKEELSEFANKILNFIQNPGPIDKLINFDTFQLSHNLTDNLCNICLNGLVITNSENDKEAIINYYSTNEGIEPIDWEQRKKM